MKNFLLFMLVLVSSAIAGAPVPAAQPESVPSQPVAIPAPVLRWQFGGCFGSWCETGWYASPAVMDVNEDGRPEIIASTYSTVALDAASGALVWRVASGHDRNQPGAANVGRTWPSVVVADLDGNGDLEFVTAHSDGWLGVYDHHGYFEPGWPQQPTPGSELRSLAVADLDGNGDLEVVVAATRSQDQWFAYEHTGALRAGDWPQHGPDSNTNGYTAGCYNQNVALGDLDGDGRGEVVGSNDTHYLAAFQDDGSQMPASTVYGLNPDGSAKVWSRVGLHVDHAVDLRGYAECGLEHRPNMANSAPLLADLDGNGRVEAVVIGNVYNCDADPYLDLYEMPFILNADRTRFGPWQVLPIPPPGAAPLSEDYNRIENNAPNPVAADLDGDGRLEILFPSYDGRLHAYWLDRSQHGDWPVEVTQPGEGFIRFASEPVVADLDGDGQAEVLFASWTEKSSGAAGRLHLVSALGAPLWTVDLPPARDGGANGVLAAPTLANIDDDPAPEIILQSIAGGVLVYDLPGLGAGRMLWPTGRGSFQRNASLPAARLELPPRAFLPLARQSGPN